jgi:hypothetical protein
MLLLIILRSIRSFAYGKFNTSFGFYLSLIGYSLLDVGLVTNVAGLFSAAPIVASGSCYFHLSESWYLKKR